MRIIFFLALSLMTITVFAQPVDMNRMNRDIEVAEQIIATLINETDEIDLFVLGGVGQNSTIEGSYLEGVGILFSIGSKSFPSSLYNISGYRGSSIRGVAIIQKDEEDFKTEVKRKKGQKIIKDTFSIHEQFKSIVETFVTEYAFVLNQVPASEKILFRYGSDFRIYTSFGSGVSVAPSNVPSKLSATVKMIDVKAFQKGDIAKEDLISKIDYSRTDNEVSESKDLNVLSGIFKRLYTEDLSDTYNLRGTPTYELIDGVGAIINLSMWKRKSNPERLVLREKMDAKVFFTESPASDLSADSLYLPFLIDFKQNVVEYGSIVKDLEEKEALIFRIGFNDCKCKTRPDQLEITAMKSTLNAYRKGKLSLVSAIQQLRIKEIQK